PAQRDSAAPARESAFEAGRVGPTRPATQPASAHSLTGMCPLRLPAARVHHSTSAPVRAPQSTRASSAARHTPCLDRSARNTTPVRLPPQSSWVSHPSGSHNPETPHPQSALTHAAHRVFPTARAPLAMHNFPSGYSDAPTPPRAFAHSSPFEERRSRLSTRAPTQPRLQDRTAGDTPAKPPSPIAR